MICEMCPTELIKRQKRFCSVKCRNEWRKTTTRDKKQYNCFCQWCGENYTRKKSQYKRSRFCSRSCQGKALAYQNLTNGLLRFLLIFLLLCLYYVHFYSIEVIDKYVKKKRTKHGNIGKLFFVKFQYFYRFFFQRLSQISIQSSY